VPASDHRAAVDVGLYGCVGATATAVDHGAMAWGRARPTPSDVASPFLVLFRGETVRDEYLWHAPCKQHVFRTQRPGKPVRVCLARSTDYQAAALSLLKERVEVVLGGLEAAWRPPRAAWHMSARRVTSLCQPLHVSAVARSGVGWYTLPILFSAYVQ